MPDNFEEIWNHWRGTNGLLVNSDLVHHDSVQASWDMNWLIGYATRLRKENEQLKQKIPMYKGYLAIEKRHSHQLEERLIKMQMKNG